MTIVKQTAAKYTGLSGDTKPTSSVITNAEFFETDTLRSFVWNGTAWFPSTPIINSSVTVFIIGSTYYAKKADGTILSSGTTAETVIQAALTLAGDICIADGTYTLSAGFTGFTISSFTNLMMARKALISIPNGFTGVVFTMGGSYACNYCFVTGGRIEEAGTAQRLWTGFKLADNAPGGIGVGNTHNFLRDTRIVDCAVGIELETTGIGWLEFDVFDNLQIWHADIGILFDTNWVQGNSEGTGLHRCKFTNIVGQAGTNVLYGVKNITGNDHSFINCVFYDASLNLSSKSAYITKNANDTKIIGGILANWNFVDDGVRSFIHEEFYYHSTMYLTHPSRRKWGIFTGTAQTQTDGLPVALGLSGTAASFLTYADGRFIRYSTGATIDNNAGLRSTTAWTMRGWNPRFKARFRVNSATNTRVFIGWTSSTTDPTGNDSLNAAFGFMLSTRTTDTVWQIAHNDGTGVTVFDAVAGNPTFDTGLHTIELAAQERLNHTTLFRYKFDSGVWTDITADIPAQTTSLSSYVEIETSDATDRTIDVFYVEGESEK